MSTNYDGPGVYRHYKGGLYEVLGLGVKEATLGSLEEEFDVVYRPLDGGQLAAVDHAFVLRPLSNFNEQVKPWSEARADDGTLPRFEKVGPIA
jgi:hypothetical protein